MKRYIVVLEKTLHGSSASTTKDVIEAKSAEQAVEYAKKAWKRTLGKGWGVHEFFTAEATATDIVEYGVPIKVS